jgi:soluble lytic murein transglycosylase-like protein
MQLVPRFHPNVNPLDPYAAIDYAAGFLRSLYDQFGSWTLAVAAYNAGPGNVQKAGNTVPPFPETLKYVADIIGDVNAAGGQVA